MNVVIVNCFDTYEHRVDLIHDILVEEGHKVQVLMSDFRHFEKKKRCEQKRDYIFFDAEPYKKNLSFQRLRSHIKLSKDIFTYLEIQASRTDLLWVLVPPNSFVKDAVRYKRKHKDVKLIFDLIDLWPETMPVGFVKRFFPFSVWRNLRDKNIHFANLVVTECNLYQEKLKKVLCETKTETLYLARPLTTYEPHLNLSDRKISLCYLGSINNIIDIAVIGNIIDEIKKKKPVELHIVGDGEKREELISISKKTGASVVFHGKVYDRVKKQRIFDSCHYGLNIMKHSVCVGLTMKSIDYMEFGLPLINNIHGDTWNLIEKYKIGINWNAHFEGIEENINQRRNARRFFENYLTKKVFREKLLSIINNQEQ